VRPAIVPTSARTPQIVAHRGSSRDEPEHTLKAYLRAMDEGADALECDVRLTADGHLVCVHDRRVNRTSNGVGRVSTLELATLEGLDWGSWKDAHGGEVEMPDRDRDRNKLLTLRHLLTTVIDDGRPIGLAIETKHPTRYAGQVERQLAKLLTELGLHRTPAPGRPWVRVMSFSQLATQRMRQLCPEVPLVLLVEKGSPTIVRYREGALPRGVRTVGLDVAIVRAHPEVVRRQHERGHQVFVWTVDDADDVDRCLELGVDAIITNRPGFVRDHAGLRDAATRND
jgi:glycerophosphoryl diester phosphodiesterase